MDFLWRVFHVHRVPRLASRVAVSLPCPPLWLMFFPPVIQRRRPSWWKRRLPRVETRLPGCRRERVLPTRNTLSPCISSMSIYPVTVCLGGGVPVSRRIRSTGFQSQLDVSGVFYPWMDIVRIHDGGTSVSLGELEVSRDLDP